MLYFYGNFGVKWYHNIEIYKYTVHLKIIYFLSFQIFKCQYHKLVCFHLARPIISFCTLIKN